MRVTSKREQAHRLIDALFDTHPDDEIHVREEIRYTVGPVPKLYTIEVSRDIKPEEAEELMRRSSVKDTSCNLVKVS